MILRDSTRLLIAAALVASAAPARAQLISPKTIPLATGEQWVVHPSARMGMGGVSIALDDPLLDPFVNPATGARLRETLLFGAPTLYHVSDDNGDGVTLPLGAVWSGERWFGGASAALQQLESAEPRFRAIPWLDLRVPQPELLSERSSSNLYASALLGRRLGDGRTALAAGAGVAALDAVDGVDLLYALSQRIEQDGHQADFRLGLLRETEAGGSLELLLLHNRFDMTHRVTYQEWMWEPPIAPGPGDPGRPGRPMVTLREEENRDRTLTWGAHLGYHRPLAAAGWRVGGIATVNFKTHPKLPNYEIMNLPRDPGHSWAYNLGAGIAREAGLASLGVDVVFEPIWSETWAEAGDTLRAADGRLIRPGERTVENEFSFRNALVRLGVGQEGERWGVQLGLQSRVIRYELDQYDLVRERRREQQESWVEWTPTWGAAARFPEFQLRYAGRMTTGTGRPGVAWTGARAADVALASTFLPAPSGPLTLQEATVVTHQLMVSVPVR